ncbi:GFA family protein [soil metagenome]
MQVQGRCHCGAITYSADVDPASVQICHCTDCQMLSGAAYRVSVRAAAETFRLLSGSPRRYVKIAESGNRRAHSFCADCGTPVHSSAVENPVAYTLRVGCLDRRAELLPCKQIWSRSSVPWSADIAEVPRVERQ